jgi:hypothetical protein
MAEKLMKRPKLTRAISPASPQLRALPQPPAPPEATESPEPITPFEVFQAMLSDSGHSAASDLAAQRTSQQKTRFRTALQEIKEYLNIRNKEGRIYIDPHVSQIVWYNSNMDEDERFNALTSQIDAFFTDQKIAITPEKELKLYKVLQEILFSAVPTQSPEDSAGASRARSWTPRVKWRQELRNEKARDFLEREYLSKPKDQRPYTHELANADPDFYRAVKALIANNKRYNRTGPDSSVDAARHLSDLFPMTGSPLGGPKERPMPTPEEAWELLSARRKEARKRQASRPRKRPGNQGKPAPT